MICQDAWLRSLWRTVQRQTVELVDTLVVSCRGSPQLSSQDHPNFETAKDLQRQWYKGLTIFIQHTPDSLCTRAPHWAESNSCQLCITEWQLRLANSAPFLYLWLELLSTKPFCTSNSILAPTSWRISWQNQRLVCFPSSLFTLSLLLIFADVNDAW